MLISATKDFSHRRNKKLDRLCFGTIVVFVTLDVGRRSLLSQRVVFTTWDLRLFLYVGYNRFNYVGPITSVSSLGYETISVFVTWDLSCLN